MSTASLDHPHATHVTVTVSYGGLSKTFTVTPHQAVQSLLELALNAFQITNNRHTQSLWSAAGQELADAQSIEGAGLVEGAHVILRASQVKGGNVPVGTR